MPLYYSDPKGTRGNPWRACQCRAQFPEMKHLKINARFASRLAARPGEYVLVKHHKPVRSWLGTIDKIAPDFRHIFVVPLKD